MCVWSGVKVPASILLSPERAAFGGVPGPLGSAEITAYPAADAKKENQPRRSRARATVKPAASASGTRSPGEAHGSAADITLTGLRGRRFSRSHAIVNSSQDFPRQRFCQGRSRCGLCLLPFRGPDLKGHHCPALGDSAEPTRSPHCGICYRPCERVRSVFH
jgi:hypothetical protein